jgi:hypothetical protein
MSLDDNKENDRILAAAERLSEELIEGARVHCEKVGAGDKGAESREFISLVTSVISTLMISTHDWLRECGGADVGEAWLEGTLKHAAINLRTHGVKVDFKVIPTFGKGT